VENTVFYLPGVQVRLDPGTQVLARSGAPYFNRTWEHSCSHQYTPMESETDEPIITQRDNLIYIARPIFSDYAQFSRRPHRKVMGNCLKRLLPRPRVGENNLPVMAVVTVRRQKSDLLVHVLHYAPQKRSSYLEVLEDVVPLHNIEMSIRAERRPQAVVLVPEGESLDWEWQDGYVSFCVPVIRGYQIIQLEAAAGAAGDAAPGDEFHVKQSNP
jgi:hypothetical protein